MISLKVKKLSPLAQIPAYQTDEAAGFDLHSIEDVILKPNIQNFTFKARLGIKRRRKDEKSR